MLAHLISARESESKFNFVWVLKGKSLDSHLRSLRLVLLGTKILNSVPVGLCPNGASWCISRYSQKCANIAAAGERDGLISSASNSLFQTFRMFQQ